MEHEGADSDVEDDPMVSAKAAEEREMELRRQRREEIKRKYEAVSSASGGSSADVSMAAGGPVSRVVAVAELVPPPAMTVVSGQSGITVARGISDGDRYAGEGDRLEQEKEATAEFESSRAESSALDMFSLSPTVLPPAPAGKGLGAKTASRLALETDYSEADNPHLHMEWDDGDGYYRARVGEVVAGRYRTLGVLGKGVFSSVLKCLDLTPPVAGLATNAVSVVAVKMIRSNDVMKKAAEKELSILTQISRSDPERRKHCVILLDRLEYRNHIALVFEHQAMNLRETIKKFGKGVGISITAVRLYARQLFVALRYLAELQVVHADIKPDNILISDDLKQVKLCDFGSAFYTHDADSNTPTPYLVSRFYRAPEIILGLSCKNLPVPPNFYCSVCYFLFTFSFCVDDHAIDVWGIGSVLFELFTGHVQFPGRSNNDMLRLMMMAKGRLPNKLIKQHVKSYEGLQMEPHFATDGNSVDLKFKQYEKDPVSDKLQMKLVDVSPHPVVQLSSTLLGAKAGSDDRKTVGHLIDLLEKASVLDQARRLTVSDALKHSIFGAPASVSIASGQRPSSGPNTAVSGNV